MAVQILGDFCESLFSLGALQGFSVSEFMKKSSVASKLNSRPPWTLPTGLPFEVGGSDALIPSAPVGSSPGQHTDIGRDVVLKFALLLTTGAFSSQCLGGVNTVLL